MAPTSRNVSFSRAANRMRLIPKIFPISPGSLCVLINQYKDRLDVAAGSPKTVWRFILRGVCLVSSMRRAG